MLPDQRGVLEPPSRDNVLSSLVYFEPRIQEIADIQVGYVANIDSSDMTPELWESLANTIIAEHDVYDGFVVVHGTDTMAYTASAISFALRGLNKPVVFTGAQIPGHKLESDARRNLVNAVRLASHDIAEIMILFGDKILLGVRASKISHTKLNAFSSVNKPKLGQIGVQLEFYQEVHKKTASHPIFLNGFESRVVSVSLIPGMPVDILFRMLEGNVKGMILSGFGTGNIPHVYLPFLKNAQENGVPVVIRSQCLEGATNMKLYSSGQSALDYGAIEAYDMSREATTTKLMWALHRAKDLQEIKTMMHTNYVGEIDFG